MSYFEGSIDPEYQVLERIVHDNTDNNIVCGWAVLVLVGAMTTGSLHHKSLRVKRICTATTELWLVCVVFGILLHPDSKS